jgi:hypothetical protein
VKTIEEIIDEIILKSPYGSKCWNDRQKRRYAVQNKSSQNEDSKTKDEPIQDHPKQTYFDFKD